jgi:hypothetical protein
MVSNIMYGGESTILITTSDGVEITCKGVSYSIGSNIERIDVTEFGDTVRTFIEGGPITFDANFKLTEMSFKTDKGNIPIRSIEQISTERMLRRLDYGKLSI